MFSSLSLEAKGLYGIICSLCGTKGACYPTIAYLEEASGKSRATVSRLIKELTVAGVILRVKNGKTGMTMTVNLMDEKNPLNA